MVFRAQRLVFLVEAVNLLHIVAQQGAQGGDFVFELGYLGGRLGLLVFQLLLQLLHLEARGLVLLGELTLDRIVHDGLARGLKLCKFVVESFVVSLKLLLLIVELQLLFLGDSLFDGFAAAYVVNQEIGDSCDDDHAYGNDDAHRRAFAFGRLRGVRSVVLGRIISAHNCML